MHRGAGKWAPSPQRELWYPPIGGTTGAHRGAGRWPPPKPRESLADPFAGAPAFKPASKKTLATKVGGFVRQLRGKEKWPMIGGTTGAHRGAGRWPPAEAAAPPPGAKHHFSDDLEAARDLLII